MPARTGLEPVHEAANILQIQLVDHVIVGQSMNGLQGYFSFREVRMMG